MIKSQTIHDYHNHIIRLINRKINELNTSPIQFIDSGTMNKYFEIQTAINELENLKEIIENDWKSSNYSKCRKGDVE